VAKVRRAIDQLDAIDVSVPPNAWVTWPLEWQPRAHPALEAFVGQLINSVAATHHLFTTTSIARPEQGASSVWLTGGIWLGGEETGLVVYNALDENGLSNDAVPTNDQTRTVAI
jgi:hypothetical protein